MLQLAYSLASTKDRSGTMLLTLLKTLANMERLRIVNLMLVRPMCLCELEIILNLSQTTCTKQVKKLVEVGFVEVKKVSLWNEYRLNSTMITSNMWLVDKLSYEQQINIQFQEDMKRYQFYCAGNYEDLFDDRLTAYIREQFDLDYKCYSL